MGDGQDMPNAAGNAGSNEHTAFLQPRYLTSKEVVYLGKQLNALVGIHLRAIVTRWSKF
ncbi:hypothetical protein C0J52_03855 [Blattella germanica]|nr:hypothetical protein C0J52_03855 [Blattella germanica]